MTNVPHYIRRNTEGGVTPGVGELLSSYCNRIRTQLDYLASKSEVSFKWYTHTNPNGCWICDTFVCAYALLRELSDLAEQLERNQSVYRDGGSIETDIGESRPEESTSEKSGEEC